MKFSVQNRSFSFPVSFPVAVVLVTILVISVDLGLYLYKWGEIAEMQWRYDEYQTQAEYNRNVLGASTQRESNPLAPVDNKWKCADSDDPALDGEEFYAGSVLYYDEKNLPNTMVDMCSDSGLSVQEVECESLDDGTVHPKVVEYECRNGCQDGACLR